MEPVYKKGNKFFGMSSGLEFSRSEVQQAHPGCWWQADAMGGFPVDVVDPNGDTRLNGGYPQFSASGKARRGSLQKPSGGLKGKGGI